ncbi:Chloride channel protein 2, partial [Pseudolycoriella hygida]
AVVGAASFAGAVTHTISAAVMALEMTGQMTLIAPIMTSLLISNAIAVHLCPSIYDTIISLKNLPYLPELSPSKQEMHEENEDLQHIPLVECLQSMILLGSVERTELIKIIAKQISREKRLHVAAQWQQEVEIRRNAASKTRSSFTEIFDEYDVTIPRTIVDDSTLVTWQEDGLKNRHPSHGETVPLYDAPKLSDHKLPVDMSKNEDNRSPEVTNSETITSINSACTILDNVKESTKLLKKSKSSYENVVGVVGLMELKNAIEDVNNGNFLIASVEKKEDENNATNGNNESMVNDSQMMEDIEKAV